MQAFEVRGNFLRRDGVNGLVEIPGLEIEQERQGQRAGRFDAARRIERGAIHDPLHPRFGAQFRGEMLGERVQVHLVFFVEQPDGQFAGLAEFAVKGLESLDRLKLLGEQVEHIGIEAHAEDDDQRRQDHHRDHGEAERAAMVRDDAGERAIQTHARCRCALAVELKHESLIVVWKSQEQHRELAAAKFGLPMRGFGGGTVGEGFRKGQERHGELVAPVRGRRMRKGLAQFQPGLERARRSLGRALPGMVGEQALDARRAGILAQREQRQTAALDEIELEILVAALLDDNVADERALAIGKFQLADVRLPRRIGRGERVRRLAAGENEGEREGAGKDQEAHVVAGWG